MPASRLVLLSCVVVACIMALPSIAPAQSETTLTGVSEYLQSLDYPEALSLKLTGVFRSMDFESYRQMTIDPFEDLSVVGQWTLVGGERYDYELSLAPAEDWRLGSLALSVLGQAAAQSATGTPSEQMSLGGSFIARYGGMMFPHYRSEGAGQRDVTVSLATLVLPDPAQFSSVETDDPGLKLARLDVLEFVNTCEEMGGEAVLTIEAPEGSTVRLWTVGHPEEAATLPVNQTIGTRALPTAPWALSIRLPEGMTVDDLPDGQVGLNLNAAGILPDWLNRGPNPAP
jgi:hypothetical protein